MKQKPKTKFFKWVYKEKLFWIVFFGWAFITGIDDLIIGFYDTFMLNSLLVFVLTTLILRIVYYTKNYIDNKIETELEKRLSK